MDPSDIFKEPVSSFRISSRKCGRTSDVWKHFGELVCVKDGKQRTLGDHYFCALCLDAARDKDEGTPFQECGVRRYAAGVSTTNLQRHLTEAHNVQSEKKKPMGADLKKFFSTTPRPQSSKNGKNLLARDFVLWLSKDLLPFNLVDGVGLQDFLLKHKVIGSKEELPDRTTLARGALSDIYECMKTAVKGIIQKGPRFCALTYDLWTDNYKRRSYITFTCHFMTDQFKLCNLTLCTQNMMERHTGKAIFDAYSRCLEDFNMVNKSVQSVTDAASNMRVAVTSAGSEHHLCMGHALHNLVTVDGFRGDACLHQLLVQCRSLVRAVHYKAQQLEMIVDKESYASVLSMVSVGEALETDEADPIETLEVQDHEYCITSVQRRPPTVKGDVPTRWHSILTMFESLLGNRRCLGKLAPHLPEDAMLVASQWDEVQELADFLKCFRVSVEILSKEKDVTASLLLVLRSEIQDSLSVSAEDSRMLKSMKERMRGKFDYRFPVNDHSVTAALLDPRFQSLTVVDDYLRRHGTASVEFLANQVTKHVRSGDVQQQRVAPDESNADTLAVLAKRHSSSHSEWSSQLALECHILLGAKCCEFSSVSGYWSTMQAQLPHLACLAKKVFCVPATSTPSERVFSIAGLIIRAKRASLHPATVDKLVFIHDNYDLCKSCV